MYRVVGLEDEGAESGDHIAYIPYERFRLVPGIVETILVLSGSTRGKG